ncbi:hypothetical protein Tco_0938169 [Tanacetum coccineum]|uniref:Tf2-1-like SH3-like domain-containing protein n=1 Tax=Tanacetum coccineum TaxID=301880 RepID=A0ABQ5DNC3_9ASTR
MQAAQDRQKSYADRKRKPMEFEIGDRVMLKVSPWKGVVRFGKRGKLNPRFVGPFKVLAKVGKVAYRLELPQELSRVHHTFHVSNLKKCYADEPLVMPLEGIHVDDKLQFVEEPVEIMEREIKRLKRSRIPLVKVRWNSRRGPEFTWEREDSFKQKYPQLFTNRASSSTTRGSRAQDRIETTSNSLMRSTSLKIHYTWECDEGSMTLNELTVLCTQLSTKVESLEQDLKHTKKGRTSADTKILLDQDEPNELVGDLVSTAAKNLVYIRRSVEKRKDKGKAIMKEDESVQKKTKKQLEQERLGYEEAIRFQEQINEEERQRIARDVEIAKQIQEEFDRARQEQEIVAEADQAHDID